MDLQKELERAVALHREGRLLEAVDAYRAILNENSRLAPVLSSLASALMSLGQYEEGVQYTTKSLRLDPNQPNIWLNRAQALHELERYEEAEGAYDRAIGCDPKLAIAYCNRGLTRQALGNLEGALADENQALKLAPNMAFAHLYRSLVLHGLGQAQAALEAADRSIALGVDTYEAYFYRGNALHALMRVEEARASFERAVTLNPQSDDALNALGAATLASSATIEQQLRVAQFHLARLPFAFRMTAFPVHDEKIRLGYFSSDYFNHATSYLIAGLIEQHDREKFEVFGFSFGPPHGDEMRRRIEGGFDLFVDVEGKSDEQIAALARDIGIDIAIDLKGYTPGGRPAIFACGAAPVQVSYLGYPATMGASFIDYLIADRTLITPAQRPVFTEKIAYLPESYQANDDKRAIAARAFTRSELGIPEGAFVFCAFNATYKITQDAFAVWMRLLNQVENGVLWLTLPKGARGVAEPLREAAKQAGIAPERIVTADFMDAADHLARHAAADLFIDTFYCSGHTTAADALWAGLPVIAHTGETFTSRVAASLLNAIGLPELIASNARDYEALALDLARDPQKLAAVKAKLAANRLTKPLFNTKRFTRHIERAYEQMHRRRLAGAPPKDFSVEPID